MANDRTMPSARDSTAFFRFLSLNAQSGQVPSLPTAVPSHQSCQARSTATACSFVGWSV